MDIDASELYTVAATLDTTSGRLGALGAAAVRKVTYDTVAGVQQQIIAMEAVDTGDMLNSVNPPEFRGDGRGTSMEGEVGPTVDYAGHVHDGTDVMAPRPFMDAPFATATEQLTAAFAALSREAL